MMQARGSGGRSRRAASPSSGDKKDIERAGSAAACDHIADDANCVTRDARHVNAIYITCDANRIMLTSDQIRAARALVRWSARELAERAGVSLPTIQRIEAAEGLPSTSVKTLDAVRRALEEAGVEFTPDTGADGPGVRLKKPR